MDIEGIMLSEVRQTNAVWCHLYAGSEKQNRWTDKTKQKASRTLRKNTGYERGAGGGRRATEEGDEDVQTSIRKRNVSQV